MPTTRRHARGRALTVCAGLYAMLVGALFFIMQSSKLLRPAAADVEMAELPFGRFDWGFVWSDTLVAGPSLLAGGILLLLRHRIAVRLGRVLVFAGFTVNLYAMVFFWVGLRAVGQPMTSGELWINAAVTSLGAVVMLHVARQAMKEKGGGAD